MKAVLDTTVLISGYITPRGIPGEILRRWRAEAFTLVVSVQLLFELQRVLERPKFRRYLDPEALPIDELRTLAELVTPIDVTAVRDDPSDDIVVGTAVAAHADVIVSGDDHLLGLNIYRGIKILTPRRFIDVLDMSTRMM